MFELPKIDVEKINKYLDFKNQKKAQGQLKKEQQEKQAQQNQPKQKDKDYITINQRQQYSPYISKPSKNNHKNDQSDQNRYNNRSTLSLNSYKSQKPNHNDRLALDPTYGHFNSMQSSIRSDIPPANKVAGITIYHKPF